MQEDEDYDGGRPQSRPAEAAEPFSNGFAPLRVKKKNSAMTGTARDQSDRYADRPAVDLFESDMPHDRQQQHVTSSSRQPLHNTEQTDWNNRPTPTNQIVFDHNRIPAHRIPAHRTERAGDTDLADSQSDSMGGQGTDMNPNFQNQNNSNTGAKNTDNSGGSKSSKSAPAPDGPSDSDSPDKPAEYEEQLTDLENVPTQHSIPTLVKTAVTHKTATSTTSKAGTVVQTRPNGMDQQAPDLEETGSEPPSDNAKSKPADIKTSSTSAPPNRTEAVDDAASPTFSDASTAVASESGSPFLQDISQKSKSVNPPIQLNVVPKGRPELDHASTSDLYSKKERAIEAFDGGDAAHTRLTDKPGVKSEKSQALEDYQNTQPESLGHLTRGSRKGEIEVQKPSNPIELGITHTPFEKQSSQPETDTGKLSPAWSDTYSDATTALGDPESAPVQEKSSKEGAGKQSQFQLNTVGKDKTCALQDSDVAALKAAAMKDWNERTLMGQNDLLGLFIFSTDRLHSPGEV
jgi:hypothetical protein